MDVNPPIHDGENRSVAAATTCCIRKLKKAVAVSGVSLGVPKENSGRIPGNFLENFPNRRMLYIPAFRVP